MLALVLMCAVTAGAGRIVPVKLGLESMSKPDRETLWKRLEDYASVDALQEFCGRKLNLQKRTWAAISPCVETSTLRKVAAVFRAKKGQYLKVWEEAYAEPEKKKALCDGWSAKLKEYARLIDAHIAEAKGMCDMCVFC